MSIEVRAELFKGMDGGSYTEGRVECEINNMDDRVFVSDGIDLILASVLKYSNNTEEAAIHMKYIIKELEIFRKNLLKS